MCAGKAAKTPSPSGMGTRGLWRHLQGLERQGLLSVPVQTGVLVETVLERAREMGRGFRERWVTDPQPLPYTALSAEDLGPGTGRPGSRSALPLLTPHLALAAPPLQPAGAPRNGSACSPPYPPALGHLRLQMSHRVAAETLNCRESAHLPPHAPPKQVRPRLLPEPLP